MDRWRALARWKKVLSAFGGMAVALVVGLPAYAYCAPFDAPEGRLHAAGTVVLGVDGVVLQRDATKGLRIPVTLDTVAPVVIQATVAAEDQRFWRHPGVDPVAVVRALLHASDTRSGASTLTQQLARRLYFPDGAGPLPVRKVREALTALQLDAHRSKDELLTLYLNDVYYGRGAYGIEAAARVYFGVSAADLDLARAAYLAGLPQLPSTFGDTFDESAARVRQAYVLGRMREEGMLSEDEAAAARAGHLETLPEIAPPIAPEFVQFALDELARVAPALAGRDGLVVETTLDPGLHQEAARLARARVEALAVDGVTNASVVVVEPGSGRIRAMVGGVAGQNTGGAFNMALQPRQPGSALKPFLYGAAFEHGATAATPLLDVAVTFATPEGPYAPQNFDRSFHGVVPLRVALASSLNVPAVRMLDEIGVDAFVEVARRFGLDGFGGPAGRGLALALGGEEVRLLDLTAAYAALADGGMYTRPYAVERVLDASGEVLYQRQPPSAARAINSTHAYLLADILADDDARALGFGAATSFDLPFEAAVKTGTTTGFRDNWTMGFTPQFAVGVWVGNTDGAPMRAVAGADGAGPLWRDVMMAAALVHKPAWVERPDGLVEATVCSPTGRLPGPDCPFPVRELFVAGTEPRETEEYYVRLPGGVLAVDPPAEARAWAKDAGLAVSESGSSEAGLRVISPASGTVAFLAPELPSQQIMFRAVASAGAGPIAFSVDGTFVGAAPGPDARISWALAPGAHELEVTSTLGDGTVARATSSFEVRPG